MKKALIIASVVSMIEQFNRDNIRILQELGYEVHVMTNFVKVGTISDIQSKIFEKELKSNNVKIHNIPFYRNPFSFKNFKAFFKVNKIIKNEKYDLVHCHSPIGGIIGRLSSKLNHVKNVIYTAHGFHFFKGSSKLSWLIFFPIEYFFSKLTDVLITINNEDFELAKKYFLSKKKIKIDGVGINYELIRSNLKDRDSLRDFYNIKNNNIVILSIGELSKRKNHIVIIKAIQELNNKQIRYYIVGKGKEESKIKAYIKENDLESQIFLEGYKKNISDYLSIADIFAFPSKREGLGLAAIEAMASGLPILTSNINGINDYSKNGLTGYSYDPDDIAGFKTGIINLLDKEKRFIFGKYNIEQSKKYDIDKINKSMHAMYCKL